MSILTVRSHLLRLLGASRSLELAEKHNTRTLYAINGSSGDIDLSLTSENLELVPLGKVSLREKVLQALKDRGIDPGARELRKKNRGFAIEFVFSCTSGHKTNFDALYAEALEWLTRSLPECPVVHAVIHYDQGSPHMHAIVVPIKDGRLQADAIRGYKQISKQRNHSLYRFLKGDYGLDYPERLRGIRKLIGADMAISAMHQLTPEELLKRIRLELEGAIFSRPEPFLAALGIDYGRLEWLQQQWDSAEGLEILLSRASSSEQSSNTFKPQVYEDPPYAEYEDSLDDE